MLKVRGRRMRLLLGGALLVLLLLGAYQLGLSLWANLEYHNACLALERFDFDEATVYVKRCLWIRPKQADFRLLAAQTARRRGDFEEASKQLRLAGQLGLPRDVMGLETQLFQVQIGNLSNAREMVAFCTAHPQDAEAETLLEALIEGSLRNPLQHLATAKWGIELWLKYRTAPVQQAQGLVWRGRFWEMQQDWPQALADFRRATELDDDHYQARIRLVEVLIREEPKQAIDDVAWLRARYPGNPEVRLQTARLLRNLGQPEEAGHLLDEILAAAPDGVPVLIERARVAMDMHQPREAERWLRHALTLAPESREVNLVLGDCFRQAGQLEEAKNFQSKAQEIAARLQEVLKKSKLP